MEISISYLEPSIIFIFSILMTPLREEAGYCNIAYSADTFRISLGTSDATILTASNAHSAVGFGFCTSDFITIPVGMLPKIYCVYELIFFLRIFLKL